MPCIHARCAPLQCPTPLAAVMQRRRQPSRSRSQQQPLSVGRTAHRRLASPLQVRWVMHSQSTSADQSLGVTFSADAPCCHTLHCILGAQQVSSAADAVVTNSLCACPMPLAATVGAAVSCAGPHPAQSPRRGWSLTLLHVGGQQHAQSPAKHGELGPSANQAAVLRRTILQLMRLLKRVMPLA